MSDKMVVRDVMVFILGIILDKVLQHYCFNTENYAVINFKTQIRMHYFLS